MIYNSNISIAFKNNTGEYIANKVSIFNLKEELHKFSVNHVNIYKNVRLSFNYKCPICEEYHQYIFNLKDLMMRNITVGGCEVTGTPIFFLGDYEEVNNRIARYRISASKVAFNSQDACLALKF